ncbi:conserved hypothetical protein [Methanolacinia petrolearia DSM 11571]|uniref:Uncharacterized protein n=1 Tax=Methanolacinia petrolearia (strain DSM 11571 / OCM 486 / SEBR 4847) TaxID=679926 RepID=E1RH31_METP4|nr:hypothetical protein [Methanolacinia petrolearia]ADN35255.1 conserved hypothetical protein [Methanolacinia petrolearia DSM 11571]
MSLPKSRYSRAVLGGIVTWLVPFLVSLLFYNQNGLTIDVFLFKSIMIVVGAIVGALMIVWYFRPETENFLRAGIIFGATALAVNWVLDLVVLCGMLGEDPLSWFAGVGVRYLVIPVMSITVGYIAEEKAGVNP